VVLASPVFLYLAVGQTELTKAHNDPVRFEKNKQHIKKQNTLCILLISYQGDFKEKNKKK